MLLSTGYPQGLYPNCTLDTLKAQSPLKEHELSRNYEHDGCILAPPVWSLVATWINLPFITPFLHDGSWL